MRKIIVSEFITLDGVIEAPGGDETTHVHGGWQTQFKSPQGGKYKIDELASAEALLLGKNTFEFFAKYWPSQSGEAFADPINKMPKYVVSSSLQKTEWHNSQIIRDVAEGVTLLKATDGGDILVYGGTLVKALLNHDLVDELRLMICPIVIGGGLKIFDDNLGLKTFKLKHSQATENGTLIVVYQPLSAAE